MVAAALGGDIEVPTIDGGRARGEDPRGLADRPPDAPARQGHAVLRSKDVGDLFLELVVETPVSLTARQKRAPGASSRSFEGKTNPQSAGFFSAVKGFWDSMKGSAAGENGSGPSEPRTLRGQGRRCNDQGSPAPPS
jgi:molecular chaperone DnaJ